MRLELCYWLHTNRQLLPLTIFTDEVTFTRDGINNTRNYHRWSQENPQGKEEKKYQRLFCITVWCGMINDMLNGPIILEDRMTGKNYLDFLQNGLPEQLGGLISRNIVSSRQTPT
jgi:hypothetical protein